MRSFSAALALLITTLPLPTLAAGIGGVPRVVCERPLKKIASDGPAIARLSPDERKAVQRFTSFGASQINRRLRNGPRVAEVDEVFVEDFSRAAKKLAKYRGTVYRFIRPYNLKDPFNTKSGRVPSYADFVKAFQRQKTHADPGYSSCTTDPKGTGYISQGKRNFDPDAPVGEILRETGFIRLEIEVRNARRIPAALSRFRWEEEVILLPGTELEVVSVKWGKNGEAYIKMKER